MLSQTNETSDVIFASPIKCRKIITMISVCPELTSQEGLLLLEELSFINFNYRDMEQVKIIRYYFTIRGLAENTKGILDKTPQSAFFIGSLISMEPKDAISEIEGNVFLTREIMISALEFLLRSTNKQLISEVMGLTREEEILCHV